MSITLDPIKFKEAMCAGGQILEADSSCIQVTAHSNEVWCITYYQDPTYQKVSVDSYTVYEGITVVLKIVVAEDNIPLQKLIHLFNGMKEQVHNFIYNSIREFYVGEGN